MLLRQIAPQEWIFKELQDIGNMEFRFAEEQPQDDYAAELAGVSLLVLLASGSLLRVGSLNKMWLVSQIIVTALCWCTCSLQK